MESNECTMESQEGAEGAERVAESTSSDPKTEAVEDDGDEEFEDVPEESRRVWPYSINRRFRLRPRKRTEPSYEGKLKRIIRTSFRKKLDPFLAKRDKNVVIVRNTRFSSFVRKTRRKELIARAITIMENRKNMQEVEIKLWQLNL